MNFYDDISNAKIGQTLYYEILRGIIIPVSVVEI